MFHLDRPMYLLGYLASQSRLYLIDKEFNVMGYTLLISLIEYKTLVMRGDLERANEILPSIPKEHHNSVAHFLESRGMTEDALEVATDPDYRFDLAMQLGKLEIAKEIATEAQSESKWKQLGELAMSTGKLAMAEECMKHAIDLSGLLLLYSSLGDAEGISRLASLSKEKGKNNVAFLCLFMLGKLEDCLQLLVESNWMPEAALMARAYLPSKVSEIVTIWRKDLNKVDPKAAESLANPQEYPGMFENWKVALDVETRVREKRLQNKMEMMVAKRRLSLWMHLVTVQYLLIVTSLKKSGVRIKKEPCKPLSLLSFSDFIFVISFITSTIHNTYCQLNPEEFSKLVSLMSLWNWFLQQITRFQEAI
ncbi:hypothetical protein J1N35_007518 [Gossypium stocksii]|uniref:COPA/B TPR domain-containing protein n=1 Tax=Gossypium stocksii TaxID=47602 RepID=A0A9D3W8M0_9ROSI|nr:hypothetical protein J1N35_007518 [Gossypium stocksii]